MFGYLLINALWIIALVAMVALIWKFRALPFGMTAQVTAMADIYEPAIWAKYFIEKTTEKSLLVQSGIAGTTPEITDAASQGGKTVTMPFWDDLAHDLGTTTRSKVATDDDTSITSYGLTTGEDIAVKMFRTQSFGAAPIVKYIAGSDPVAVIVDRYAEWWRKEEQRLLLKILTGVFADSTLATALSNDISGAVQTTDAAKLISSGAVEDTRFLLGDAYEKFTAMIVHSTVFKRLRLLDLIDYTPESQQNPQVPIYMGLRVLVDDGMTNTAGSTYKYTTYLFGTGAIARADIPMASGDPEIEVYRQPMKGTGAGQVDVITRRYFILHPRGVAYTGSVSGVTGPSDADLVADNWTQAFLTKNIRIARLITNG